MYVPIKVPYAHQEEALRRLRGRRHFGLLMAMRTGKTKTVLDDFGRLEDESKVESLLVIAPAGVYHTWEKAIEDHVSVDLRERMRVMSWVSGRTSESQLKRFLSYDGPRVFLVNIEALSVVKDAKAACVAFLSQRPTMLVIDESTAMKNHRAKRTKFIMEELKPLAAYRRILSGLPTPKSPLDLYTQFTFLDEGIFNCRNYYAFRARYAKMERRFIGGRYIDLVVGYRDVDELARLIAPHSYRVTLEDCYDLPPKIYQRREVPLSKQQKKVYDDVKEYATALLASGDHVSTKLVIDQILKLHQIACGHVTDENGVIHMIPHRRIDALIDLLSEHEGKTIIWCSYDVDIRAVAKAIEEMEATPEQPDKRVPVARFWGGNVSTREEEESAFVNDPNVRYMVATASAGGRGRTWTCADMVVYYSNTYDLEHRAQSEERAQGVDKVRSVLYVDMVAPGTVDEKILAALKAKINMASAITGDDWKEWLE